VALLNAVYRQADGSKCAIDGGNQLIDSVGGRSEEVEIAGLTLDVTANDHRAATGKSKVPCLI
jgi:hypothetical protein